MTKRLAIKTGEYEKDGQTKGEYVDFGVIMTGEHGDYLIIDPAVSLAGCMTKQNIMNHRHKKQIRTSLLVSVFDDDDKSNDSSQDYDDNIPY